MNGLTTILDRSLVSSNFEHDSSKIKEILLNINPYLNECPIMIQNICSVVQSKYSLDSIKSLVTKALTGGEKRIEDNLTDLLNIYEKDPLCRAAKFFLEKHREDILQLLDQPEKADEKFCFFEQQTELAPLLPFFKEIRKEFDKCSQLSKPLFQDNFDKEVYKIVLVPPVQRGRSNFIHASNGHCTGSMLAQAVPIKGMNAAFMHTPYHLFNFFNVYNDRNISSNFGKQYLRTDQNLLLKHLPNTFIDISRILLVITNSTPKIEFDYAELIGRIAGSHLFGTNFQHSEEKPIICNIFKSDLNLKFKNRESFKIVGLYILKHLNEFKKILPAEFNTSTPCENVGEWAYNLTTDLTLHDQPYWNVLLSMFSQFNKIVSLYPYIETRGLKFVELIEFNKPFEDFELHLSKINFKVGDHYNIGLKFDGGMHALSLKFKDNLFTFADPNHYHPITHLPINQTFENIQDCFSFMRIFISFWYTGKKNFSVSKYSEIPTSTPQMREYQFGQNLAQRASLLSEATTLGNWCSILKYRLTSVKSADEAGKIKAKIAQMENKLESIQKEGLRHFQVKNRRFIEEKISLYAKKNKIKPSKSYELVIQSLRDLLAPRQAF